LANFGEVVVAVGTGGAAPSLAGWLRDRVAAAVPARIAEFAATLAPIRDQLQSLVADPDARRRIMKHLAGEEMYERFAAEGPDAMGDGLAQAVKSEIRNSKPETNSKPRTDKSETNTD
jgi:siroheme synthase (precorrin-2 oxidase/ferrochelatase)